jgi:hypothetical protein
MDIIRRVRAAACASDKHQRLKQTNEELSAIEAELEAQNE